MIPRAFITEWQNRVPWPEAAQVEQDLILSRLMLEIASDELLKNELVMRGGTCLHKVHLPEPYRYSEDLDYVRRTNSRIGPYLDQLREIAERVGLTVAATDRPGQMVHMILDAEPTIGPGTIRIKVETNIAETTFFKKTTTIDHVVESRWWSGIAPIQTFVIDELMATKLRALYQRRKGRDLFDIWLVLTTQAVTPAVIVDGLRHYMKADVFDYHAFARNLHEKLEDRGFRSDLDSLVTATPSGYNVDDAADLVIENLAVLLDNAPDIDAVVDRKWRQGR